MNERETLKKDHERSVAHQLLQALQIDAHFEGFGDPDKKEPDVIYKLVGKTLGIEVATAYYENSDAKDAAVIGAGEKPLATDEVRSRSGGILRSPDELICDKIQAELHDKCGKQYVGAEDIWLCINQDAALSDADSVAECLKKLQIPTKHRFAKIYLTYMAPGHEGGKYTKVQLF